MSRLLRRLRALGARSVVEREMDEEMRAHLEMEIEERIREGAAPEEARRTSMRDFGAMDRFKEEGREARGIGWVEAFRQDVRFAARSLLRSPGFAVVAVLTLALGIGASTAIFSVVDGVLLRPLPFPEPDRIVMVWQLSRDGGEHPFSHPNFEDVRERSRSFEALAEYGQWTAPLSVPGSDGEAERTAVATVSDGFFQAVGVQPFLGRAVLPEDVAENAPVAVVSERFWRERLGRPPELEGQALRVGTAVVAVVGVMPEGFSFPSGAQIWFSQESQVGTSRTAHNWRVVGRLRSGVRLEDARLEIDLIARQLEKQYGYGDDTNMASATANPLHEEIVGGVRPALLVLLAAAGLLLLIATANVVNLLLARAAGRRRELAVRLAVGAGRGRLVRQFLAESLVLTALGGVVGLAVGVVGTSALLTLEPGRVPRVDEVGVSGAVLAFAVGISLLSALMLGTVTAIRASRGALRDALTADSRSHSDGGGSQRLRSGLMVGQVALTLVLLVGAGLLGRSFVRLLAIDPGYRTNGAIVMDLLIPYSGDDAGSALRIRFTQELLDRLSDLPSVGAAGAVNVFPLSGGGSNGTFLILHTRDEVEDFDDWRALSRNPERAGPPTDYRIATAGYFQAMGIPLVRGRMFDARDHPDAPPAAVISETLARVRWPDEDPVGKLIQFGNMDGDLRPFTIVGVVGDVRERSLEAEPRPVFYGNAVQRPNSLGGPITLVMSGSSPPEIVGPARRIVRSLDPEVPLRFRTLEAVFSESLSARRFSLVLFGAFAMSALLLSVGGIYGVISYLVAQRTREIGIRLALGAANGDVLRLVVGRGIGLVLLGIVLGLAAAAAGTRAVSGLLYAVGEHDPVVFLAVPIVLLIVGGFASYIPARRATRVDAMIAIRAE